MATEAEAEGGSAPVVAVPELDVVAGVFQDVFQLGGVHLPHGLGRHAHDEPAGGHDLPGRHQRARTDLRPFLDHRAIEDDGADADAHVVHDPAGVDDRAEADRDVVADDARELQRHVQHRTVLDVRVPSEGHVVVLVAPQHGEGPDGRAGRDRHVADHGRLRVDVRVGIDAWPASRKLADHEGVFGRASIVGCPPGVEISRVGLYWRAHGRRPRGMISQTAEVREAHRFDVSALERYMRERVEGFGGSLEVRQFRGGQSNPTYHVSAGGREYVLRRKPPGKLLSSAHAVDRAYRVITALATTG